MTIYDTPPFFEAILHWFGIPPERVHLINEATLEGDPDGPLTLRVGIIVDAYELYLPLILRNGP